MRIVNAFLAGLFIGWLATNFSEVPKETVRSNLTEFYRAVIAH